VLAAGYSAILLGTLMRQNLPDGVREGTTRLLSAPMLRPVAILSYSLYLAHMAVIPAAKMASDALFPDRTAHIVAEFADFGAIYMILSVLLAGILHFTVEKPFLGLRDTRF